MSMDVDIYEALRYVAFGLTPSKYESRNQVNIHHTMIEDYNVYYRDDKGIVLCFDEESTLVQRDEIKELVNGGASEYDFVVSDIIIVTREMIDHPGFITTAITEYFYPTDKGEFNTKFVSSDKLPESIKHILVNLSIGNYPYVTIDDMREVLCLKDSTDASYVFKRVQCYLKRFTDHYGIRGYKVVRVFEKTFLVGILLINFPSIKYSKMTDAFLLYLDEPTDRNYYLGSCESNNMKYSIYRINEHIIFQNNNPKCIRLTEHVSVDPFDTELSLVKHKGYVTVVIGSRNFKFVKGRLVSSAPVLTVNSVSL